MRHVEACGANGGTVEPYPYSNTKWLSAGGVRDHYGLDTGSSSIEVKLPRDHADIMTYCSPQWMSDYTFEKLLDQLQSNAGIPLSSWDPGTEYLMIMGDIEPETGEVGLLPIMHVQGDEIDPDVWTNPDGDYAVRLVDAQETVLFERTFGLIDEPHDEGGRSITLFVPYDDDMARLVILHNGTELKSVTVSPNSPTVVLHPVTGAMTDTVSGTLTVSWTASDADGDDLSASVYFSADGGDTWELTTLGLTRNQVRFDTSLWPHTGRGMLRVEVNDGINTGKDVSKPFTVPAKAPAVFAVAPENGATLPPGSPVSLTATGYDAEDGPMEGDALAWSSNRDGELGSGTQIVATDLSLGWHEITVTATDSDNNTATDSIQIHFGHEVYLPLVLRH
jgi:hypothetical protein